MIFGSDKCRCEKYKVATKCVFRSEKIVAACRWYKCRCEKFARTINIAAKTSVLQQQLISLP
jgi:hypothetical protein